MAERKKAFAEARVAEDAHMNDGSPESITKRPRSRDVKKAAKRIEDEKNQRFSRELDSIDQGIRTMNFHEGEVKSLGARVALMDQELYYESETKHPRPQYDELALDGRFGDRREAMEQLGDINELNVITGKRLRRIVPTPVIDFNDLRQQIPKNEPMDLQQWGNEIEDSRSLSKTQRRKARELGNIEKEKAKQVSAKERKATRAQARQLRENKREAQPGGDHPSMDMIMARHLQLLLSDAHY